MSTRRSKPCFKSLLKCILPMDAVSKPASLSVSAIVTSLSGSGVCKSVTPTVRG